MPKEWSSGIERIQAGGKITKADGGGIVGAWHQEIRDLALIMSRIVSCRISTKLSRPHQGNSALRLADDIQTLCDRGWLSAELDVPNAASPIKVLADLTTRTVRISMTIDAPKDRARSVSRINWLVRQLKVVDVEDVYIGTIWASRAADTVLSLEEVRANPEKVVSSASGTEIRAFEVTLTSSSGRRFSGIRTFIEELENLTPKFYEQIGQYLRTWQAPPPKPKHKIEEVLSGEKVQKEQIQVVRQTEPELPAAGNAHGELLEIPKFLERRFD